MKKIANLRRRKYIFSKEKFKKQIEEIVNEAKSRCYGNVPYHLQSVIDALLAKKTVDWRILLNYF